MTCILVTNPPSDTELCKYGCATAANTNYALSHSCYIHVSQSLSESQFSIRKSNYSLANTPGPTQTIHWVYRDTRKPCTMVKGPVSIKVCAGGSSSDQPSTGQPRRPSIATANLRMPILINSPRKVQPRPRSGNQYVTILCTSFASLSGII